MPIPAMTPHARHESAGDAALLALVDSRGNLADTSLVDATGWLPSATWLPPPRARPGRRSLDPGTPRRLCRCRHRPGRPRRALSAAETELLATGVTEAGLGLVNFDGALWLYKAPLLRLMALDVGPLPVCSDLLRISQRQHYLNRTLPPGSLVRLKRPVSFADVRGAGRHVSDIA